MERLARARHLAEFLGFMTLFGKTAAVANKKRWIFVSDISDGLQLAAGAHQTTPRYETAVHSKVTAPPK